MWRPRITPSYVAFTDDERLIGEAAKNQAAVWVVCWCWKRGAWVSWFCFSGVLWCFIGFYGVLLGFIGFYGVLLGLYCVLWCFIVFYWVLLGFIGVLLGLTPPWFCELLVFFFLFVCFFYGTFLGFYRVLCLLCWWFFYCPSKNAFWDIFFFGGVLKQIQGLLVSWGRCWVFLENKHYGEEFLRRVTETYHWFSKLTPWILLTCQASTKSSHLGQATINPTQTLFDVPWLLLAISWEKAT